MSSAFAYSYWKQKARVNEFNQPALLFRAKTYFLSAG